MILSIARQIRLLAILLLARPLFSQTPAPAASGYDWGYLIVSQTNALVTAKGGILVNDGLAILAFIGGGLVLWEVIKWGMGRLGFWHYTHWPFGEIVMLFVKMGFLAYLLEHYIVPFNGLSTSFHQFPMVVSQHIVNQLDQSAITSFMAYVQSATTLVDPPKNPLAIIDNMMYLQILVIMGFVSAVMFLVTASGYVLTGVFTVIGPYFIPLWMFRGGHANTWAWNWFSGLIAFAFYRVISTAIGFVLGNMWIYFFVHGVGQDYSIANWIVLLPIVYVLTLFSVALMFMVPLITAALFSGAGAIGQSAASVVGNAVRTAVAAA